MMKNERDPWVRVKDESELRAGMAVKEAPCSGCGYVHVGILLHREPEPTICVYCGEPCRGWTYTAPCATSEGPFCLKIEIRCGHLYRLADGQLADDAEPTTVVRGREMERAR